MLWEMLAGRRLFKAENEAASLHNTLTAEIPPLGAVRAGVPGDLGRIVARALKRDPEQRYPTAEAMALELRGWARAHGVDAKPVRARGLLLELFGEELEAQRRRVEELVVPAEAAPISGSLPLPRLHLPGALGNATPGTNLSGTVALVPEGPPRNPLVPLVWSLLVIAGFSIGLLAYDIFTRPRLVAPAAVVQQPALAVPIAVAPAPAPTSEPPRASEQAIPEAGAMPPAAAAVRPRGPAQRRPGGASELAGAALPVAPSATPIPLASAVAAPTSELGYLTLDTTPWANVSTGAKSLGQTPIVRAELPAGTHVLLLVNPDQNLTTRYQVRIEPGKTTVRRIGLE